MGCFGAVFLLGCLLASSALAAPEIRLVPYASGFRQPTHVTHAGDGSGRLFVTEQRGSVRIIRNGAVLPEPFLDISARVSCCGERGLLSIAFPPGYPEKRHFYAYYTDRQGDIVISRFRLGSGPDVADPASETVLLTINHRQFGNHNGGQLAFGPDGSLYIGTGDGGGAGDSLRNGQNTNSLLGKLLRIDVESGAVPYSIPAGNPFAGRGGFRGEIWAYGLRNPWRFSFDRETRDLYIADVGQNRYEEINFQPASAGGSQNYGWNIMEGRECFQSGCNPAGLTLPVAQYPHGTGDCSVTGGFVYRGARFPFLRGIYFYGDYCTGKVWALERAGDVWTSSLLLDTAYGISSFGEDEAGELYVADGGGGGVYLLAGAPSVVNSASYEAGAAPGAIVSIFGSGLTKAEGIVDAGKAPLPRELSGTSVTVNGVPAPLFAVANVNGLEQVNMQIPYEIAAGSRASVVVTNNQVQAAVAQVEIFPAHPGVFTTDGTRAAALHAVDFQPVSAVSPAGRDEAIILYATGLGPVQNPPATGEVAPLQPLSPALEIPRVTIGGIDAAVLFAGLAPNYAGLYQLNVRVPQGTAPGDQDVVVTVTGRAAKPVKLAVR
jgi:uncharacterized protein (TIGR03437 family)